MTLSRRRFLGLALGAVATLAVPDPTVALPTDDEVRRFWPGWRQGLGARARTTITDEAAGIDAMRAAFAAPARVSGLDAFITADNPPPTPLDPARLERELRELFAKPPDPYDILFVRTAPGTGDFGLWTGDRFVPLAQNLALDRIGGGAILFVNLPDAQRAIPYVSSEQLDSWTR